jgi:hypothetical protein
VDPWPQLELLELRLDSLALRGPHRDANRIHTRYLKKRLYRANQYWHATNA